MNCFARHRLVSRLLRSKVWLGLALPCVFLALLAGLTQGQRCASLHTPAACNGQDPIEQDCAAPEQTAVIAAEPIDTDRTAQVRYSIACQTIWGRIVDARSGTYFETITLDGTSYHGRPRYVQGYYYTPMALLSVGQTVHLVVHPATVARDATVTITLTGPTSATTPRGTPSPQRTPTPSVTPKPPKPTFPMNAPHQGP